MKVTVQFDEAAEMSPREARLMHQSTEHCRQLNRRLTQCELEQVVVVRTSEFGQTLGELFGRKGAV